MHDPEMRLTPHFRLSEFDCKDGTRVPQTLITGLVYLCEWWLEPFRAEFGRTDIMSGFRTVSHNGFVGGATRSVHLGKTNLPGRERHSVTRAAAADVFPHTGTVKEWHAWAVAHRKRSRHLAAKGRGGIGLYVKQEFLHLDTASLRDWTG